MSKKKDKKKDKKADKASRSRGSTLAALAQSPLVADVVASALVATAAALKNPKRARALASEAGEELTKLSRNGVKAGDALWEMALQIGRRSLDALATPKASKKTKGDSRPSGAEALPSTRTAPAKNKKK